MFEGGPSSTTCAGGCGHVGIVTYADSGVVRYVHANTATKEASLAIIDGRIEAPPNYSVPGFVRITK